MQISSSDLIIPSMGTASFASPYPGKKSFFINPHQRIAYHVELDADQDQDPNLSFETVGPREKIFYDPQKTNAAIVTCGGLSPGLNAVIRSLVHELSSYGTNKILGIRHGYKGLVNNEEPLLLDIPAVEEIHLRGGTILGSSRGSIDLQAGISFLKNNNVKMLFCVGGDGTQRGALALSKEAKKHNYPLTIVGIPKTIDNDVPFVYQSFGFLTAVEKAKEIIVQAHTEVSSYDRSVAIVKLMGRDTGFITMQACIAAQLADIALIPEVPFTLHDQGETKGLLSQVKDILDRKTSCVLVVAEGAGQDLFNGDPHLQADLSGNKKFNDIGFKLVNECRSFLGKDTAVRYFDPSYSIRAVPANVADSMLCDGLARAAVHAAYAGKTELLIGLWYNNLVHVPIETVCKFTKKISPESKTWQQLQAMLSF